MKGLGLVLPLITVPFFSIMRAMKYELTSWNLSFDLFSYISSLKKAVLGGFHYVQMKFFDSDCSDFLIS